MDECDGIISDSDVEDVTREIQFNDWERYSQVCQVEFPEKFVADKIYLYASPIFLVLGMFGSLVNITVLYAMSSKVLSTCMYLLVASIIDIFVLALHCGNEWLEYLIHVNFAERAKFSSASMCKIYPFISNFVIHLSIWMIVSMATETTMVSLKVERMLRICVKDRARAVVLLITVLLICVNAHCFWTYAITKGKVGAIIESCTDHKQGQMSDEFRRIVWPIINIVVTHLFPYLSIFSCTIIMVTRRVHFKRNQVADASSTWKDYKMDGPGAREFHYTIAVICLVYLILLLPKFACDILLFLVEPNYLKLVSYTYTLKSKIMLAKSICSSLFYMFICFKLFIFLLTSQKFRSELLLLVTCKPCKKKPSPRKLNNRYSTNRNAVKHSNLIDISTPMLDNNMIDNSIYGDLDCRNDIYNYKQCNSFQQDEKKAFAITSV